MCSLGKEIERVKVSQEDPIIGYRGWYITNTFNDKEEKKLKSLNCDYTWNENQIEVGDIDNKVGNTPLGIYCYNYYNYNYYNYYNNNYYNNNYYNYYIAGKCNQFGDVVKHVLGQRSSQATIHSLVILDDSIWFKGKTEKFANHFNDTIKSLADRYNVPVIGYSEYSKT